MRYYPGLNLGLWTNLQLPFCLTPSERQIGKFPETQGDDGIYHDTEAFAKCLDDSEEYE